MLTSMLTLPRGGTGHDLTAEADQRSLLDALVSIARRVACFLHTESSEPEYIIVRTGGGGADDDDGYLIDEMMVW